MRYSPLQVILIASAVIVSSPSRCSAADGKECVAVAGTICPTAAATITAFIPATATAVGTSTPSMTVTISPVGTPTPSATLLPDIAPTVTATLPTEPIPAPTVTAISSATAITVPSATATATGIATSIATVTPISESATNQIDVIGGCVEENGDTFDGFFSYVSAGKEPLYIQTGNKGNSVNVVSPAPLSESELVVFRPGVQEFKKYVQFSKTSAVTWSVKSPSGILSSTTLSASSPKCAATSCTASVDGSTIKQADIYAQQFITLSAKGQKSLAKSAIGKKKVDDLKRMTAKVTMVADEIRKTLLLLPDIKGKCTGQQCVAVDNTATITRLAQLYNHMASIIKRGVVRSAFNTTSSVSALRNNAIVIASTKLRKVSLTHLTNLPKSTEDCS